MRIGKWSILALLLVSLAACGEDGDNVSWKGVFTGGESTGSATGGATVGASGTLATRPDSPWIVDAPAPFLGPTGSPDLGAIGQALVLTEPDRRVLDAISTPLGPVALLADPAGEIELALLAADGARTAAAPPGAHRLLLVSADPLRVEILLADGLSALATLL